MSAFVFVPGAFHGGWCWSRVRARLSAEGHEVFTPSLTGLGDRRHLLHPSINFETHVKDITSLLNAELLNDVILVGHSYGGTVISAVADRLPQQIRALVYVDALVPEHGERVVDILPADTATRIVNAAREFGEGWWIPPAPAAAYNMTGNDATWLDRQCGPHPLAAMLQPILLGSGLAAVADKIFVYATGWGAQTSISPSYERAKALGWRTLEWSCGHGVMVERPKELADLLSLVAHP